MFERFSHLFPFFDLIAESVFFIDENGTFVFANTFACERLGYPHDEIRGQRISEIDSKMGSEDWDEFLDLVRRDGSLRFDSVHRGRDGQEFPVEIRLHLISHDDRAPLILVSALDQSQQTLERQRLERVVSAADLGFWEWFPQQGDVYVSPVLLRQLGETEDQPWTIESFEERLHPEDREQTKWDIEQVFRGVSDRYESRFRIRHRDGSYRLIRSTGSVDRDSQGKVVRLIGTHLDSTDQRSVEQRLVRSNADLEQFAYAASHDLRSPLRGLAHLATWIVEDAAEADVKLPANVSEHLEKIIPQVRRMETLLDGLLEFSTLGGNSTAAELIDLQGLLDEIIELIDGTESFDIRWSSPPAPILTERSPLQRTIANLIDNAVKHHDRGSGSVILTAIRHTDLFQFEVTDDGPGIPPAARKRVFEIFQTLQPGMASRSGIGLTLVQKLVQDHGGEIEIDPLPGRGTTFRFTWTESTNDAR